METKADMSFHFILEPGFSEMSNVIILVVYSELKGERWSASPPFHRCSNEISNAGHLNVKTSSWAIELVVGVRYTPSVLLVVGCSAEPTWTVR
jgi:hypothetical protein